MATRSTLNAQVIRASRVYEASADYDAYLREYSEALYAEGRRSNPALVRAKLDVEIAKDMSANVLTQSGKATTSKNTTYVGLEQASPADCHVDRHGRP